MGGANAVIETSTSLANHPELIHMERVPAEPATFLARINIPGAYSGIWWYGDYPDHYARDARSATAEKGKKLQDLALDGLTKFIKAVKKDTVTPALEKEFFEREAKLRA